MKTSARIAAVVLVAAALPAVGASAAHAGDNEVSRQGSCSGSADWKIKAKPDDGRLEVEAEVDSNRSGQDWRWKFKHDGRVFDRGTATTGGRSGSFEIERKPANGGGTDSFKFRAVNRASGQVCVARVSI